MKGAQVYLRKCFNWGYYLGEHWQIVRSWSTSESLVQRIISLMSKSRPKDLCTTFSLLSLWNSVSILPVLWNMTDPWGRLATENLELFRNCNPFFVPFLFNVDSGSWPFQWPTPAAHALKKTWKLHFLSDSSNENPQTSDVSGIYIFFCTVCWKRICPAK